MEETRNNIKVLLVSPYSAKKVGGIGTWSKSIIDSFNKSKSVKLFFQNTAFFLKHNAKKEQTIFRRLLIGSIDTSVILSKLFLNCLINRPNVIHYTSSASWALQKDKIAIRIAKLFNIPFIIHWHFGRIPSIIEEKGREYLNLSKVLNSVTYSIVIDESSYHSLRKEGFLNIGYIPNALPDSVLTASNETNNTHRKEGVVLFVGQILRSKGVYELVRSCVAIPDVKRLIMAGPYTLSIYNDLKEIASEREKGNWLQFLGEVSREDVFCHYRECSLFVLPSYTEGFPYVILEAMAFGCAIVATDVGAIPQVITKDTGILIPVKNESSLQNAIKTVLANRTLASYYGNNARKEIINHFTTECVMKQYQEIWLNFAN